MSQALADALSNSSTQVAAASIATAYAAGGRQTATFAAAIASAKAFGHASNIIQAVTCEWWWVCHFLGAQCCPAK